MGTIRKGILVLDPRTKILLLLGINIFVFTNSHVYAEMLVVAALVILLLLCGVYKTALKSRIVFVATHDRELMGLLCTRRMEISNESISVYDLTTK